MNLKKIIRITLLTIFLLTIIPSAFLIIKLKNDSPLKIYLIDDFLPRLQIEIKTYFTPNTKENLDIQTLNIIIEDSIMLGLKTQIENRINDVKFENAKEIGNSPWEYVRAKILTTSDTLDVKLRIRGDMLENYNSGFENATFRINIGGGKALHGKKKLSLIRPELEGGYYGYLFYKCFKEHDFLSNHIELIKLKINGEDIGIRYLQEGFSKELIESSNRREGPILRFKNDCIDSQGRFNESLYPELVAYKEKKTLKTESLSKIYARALSKYDEMIKGNINISTVFNIDEYARFYALCDIFISHHANSCHNVKLYYNPINDKFEPISWDPGVDFRYKININNDLSLKRYGKLCNNPRSHPIHHLLSKNEEFLKKYTVYLQKYIENDTIIKMIEKYSDIIKYVEPNLFNENYTEQLTARNFSGNIEDIKKDFNLDQHLYGNYYTKTKTLTIRSISNLPTVIDSIKYKGITKRTHIILSPNSNIEKIIPFDLIKEGKSSLKIYSRILTTNKVLKYKAKIFFLKDNFSESSLKESFDWSYFEIDSLKNVFKLKDKKLKLTHDLHIPDIDMIWILDKGTEIELKNANIICENPVNFNGTFKHPIIFKSDYSGGFFVKNTDRESVLKNTKFTGLIAPYKDNWSLSGAVTFYKSNVFIDSCSFQNNMSEDALNLVNCKFKIFNTEIKNCSSDALDIDFGEGEIKSIVITSSKNDGLDFSGSNIFIQDVNIYNIGDKAISAGERTLITGKNITIDKSFIGIASKDSSLIKFENVILSNTTYNFTAYQKKSQFGKSNIIITNSKVISRSSLIEFGCFLSINDSIFKGTTDNIYKKLYSQ